jgi:hypothetical protein
MGGSTSTIESCVYNKNDFENKIIIIKDAHEIVQYYANLLMNEKMPLKFEYLNYNSISEDYFNSRRKDVMGDLQSINSKINNYYDIYNGLNNLEREYEKNDITENERRTKITEVWKLTYAVLKLLIEELWESCDIQGRPVPEPESESDSDISSE